jgi:DNA-binding NarL/FixJ family response regulator
MTVMVSASPIRVLVCDDVAELRGLVRSVLDDDVVQVVGEADNGPDAVSIAAELKPDVVVLDLSMPGLDGLEAIPLIACSSPDSGIVVFSGFAGERLREAVIARGADRYVEKGEPLSVLATAVREVAEARRNADGRG